MELLVAPVVHGDTHYYSYIIVHKDSPITTFEELRGKNFACSDPQSCTGCLVPSYELSKKNETYETFFNKCDFTKSHDNSISAIAGKLYDGAAVDSIIWEYFNSTEPKYTSKTKIIKKIGPFGIPPIVVHPKLDISLKEDIKNIMLNMHKDDNAVTFLKKIHIDRFVIVKDSIYDSVRKMQELLNKNRTVDKKTK